MGKEREDVEENEYHLIINHNLERQERFYNVRTQQSMTT